MQLENKFTIEAPLDKAWKALNTPETIAPCFPGATLTEYEGDSFTGTVKVKLGPDLADLQGQGHLRRARRGGAPGGDRGRRARLARQRHRQRHGHRHAGRRRAGQDRGHHGHRHDDHRPAGPVRPRRDLRRGRQDHRPVRAAAWRTKLAPPEDGAASTSAAADGGTPAAGSGPAADRGPAGRPRRRAAATAPRHRRHRSRDGDRAGAVRGAGGHRPTSEAASSPGPAAAAAAPRSTGPLRSEIDAIDLLDTAGAPVLKRLAPVAGGGLLLVLVILLIRRLRG